MSQSEAEPAGYFGRDSHCADSQIRGIPDDLRGDDQNTLTFASTHQPRSADCSRPLHGIWAGLSSSPIGLGLLVLMAAPQVTFRYYDPSATSVRIRGEWYFSDPAHTTMTSSQGLLPSQWQPGDFPIAYPNQGPAANWPVAQMTLDQATGVWSYTTPLPSGTFTYGFYVDCTSPAPQLSGCTELSDPHNPPWNTSGSVEPTSQVYVPSDPRFGTLDLSSQAPRRHGGTLSDVSYPDPHNHHTRTDVTEPHTLGAPPDRGVRWRRRGGASSPARLLIMVEHGFCISA